jgi:hypothetical protein
VVSPKVLRDIDETADVVRSIDRRFAEIRNNTTKETQRLASNVRVHAENLLGDLKTLKEHIEKNEDIA